MNTREERAFDCEFRGEKDPMRLMGRAAVFHTKVDVGPFREVIMPGAFAHSLATDDIRALWDHDTRFVLGRNRSGTLRLQEDDAGLLVEIDLPDTTYATDFYNVVKRGDVSQMSFGFTAEEQEWAEDEDGELLRRLTRVKLWEVSPVTFPAYDVTRVVARSAIEAAAMWNKQKGRSATIYRARLRLQNLRLEV